jgi:hypothetical protein
MLGQSRRRIFTSSTVCAPHPEHDPMREGIASEVEDVVFTALLQRRSSLTQQRISARCIDIGGGTRLHSLYGRRG